MATEVLRPHDVLIAHQLRHIPAILPSRKPKQNPNPKPSRKTPSPRSEARKRREGSAKPAKTGEGKRQAAGRVTILKRGETLDAFRKPEAAAVFVTGRVRQDPEMGRKKISMGGLKAARPAAAVYAGSAFSVSPSPSSLPLPSFSVKKEVPAIVDYATKDLRRLLHLE